MSLGSVKQEPHEVRADLSDLYDGHVVKKELVFGPVVLQPPDSVYNLNSQNGLVNVKEEQDPYIAPSCHAGVCKAGIQMGGRKEYGTQMGDSDGSLSWGLPTDFDELVKRELLKCEADDCKLNGKHEGVCPQEDPQAASSHASPDSTQDNSLITEKLQRRVKLQPKLSSRMRIQYETDTEFKKITKKPKIFQCNYCGKRFSLKQGLSNHIRTHTGERPYKCKPCSKKFSDCAVLVRHRRMHEGQKPHTCDICGKKYSEKYLLKNHKLVHTGEMQYFCTHCPKSFVNSSNFRRHQRMHVHKYVCDVCKRNFADEDSLVSHIKYHMKPKPHACKFCGKRFGQSGHLNRHVVTHTGPTKVHTCGLCSKVFSQKAALTKHVSRKVCEKKR